MSSWATKVNNETEPRTGPSFQVPGPLARLLEYPRRFRQFLHEVRVEMKQVTWPSSDDVRSTTLVVILTVAFFAAFFFVVDGSVAYIVERVFKVFQR